MDTDVTVVAKTTVRREGTARAPVGPVGPLVPGLLRPAAEQPEAMSQLLVFNAALTSGWPFTDSRQRTGPLPGSDDTAESGQAR